MTAAASATATSAITVSVRRSATQSASHITCYVFCTVHRRDGTIREKKRCDSMPVYRVFTPQPLDMCNAHFNEYFESHEIAVDMVMRLSDNEDDFVPGNYKASKLNGKRSVNGSENKDGDSCSSRLQLEPICQVPRPRRK